MLSILVKNSTLWRFARAVIAWRTPWSNSKFCLFPSMPFGLKFNIKELCTFWAEHACTYSHIGPLVYLTAWAKVSYSRHHDILAGIGFVLAIQALRRVVEYGTVWLGVPCSSWVWLSRATTRRCKLRPRGNKKYQQVKLANKLVRRVCYLLLGLRIVELFRNIMNFKSTWFQRPVCLALRVWCTWC